MRERVPKAPERRGELFNQKLCRAEKLGYLPLDIIYDHQLTEARIYKRDDGKWGGGRFRVCEPRRCARYGIGYTLYIPYIPRRAYAPYAAEVRATRRGNGDLRIYVGMCM